MLDYQIYRKSTSKFLTVKEKPVNLRLMSYYGIVVVAGLSVDNEEGPSINCEVEFEASRILPASLFTVKNLVVHLR